VSVRQSVCPISQIQQRHAAGLLLSAICAKDINRQHQTPGSSSAAARAAAWRSAANVGNVMLTAELTRLNTDRLLSILGLLKF